MDQTKYFWSRSIIFDFKTAKYEEVKRQIVLSRYAPPFPLPSDASHYDPQCFEEEHLMDQVFWIPFDFNGFDFKTAKYDQIVLSRYAASPIPSLATPPATLLRALRRPESHHAGFPPSQRSLSLSLALYLHSLVSVQVR